MTDEEAIAEIYRATINTSEVGTTNAARWHIEERLRRCAELEADLSAVITVIERSLNLTTAERDKYPAGVGHRKRIMYDRECQIQEAILIRLREMSHE